MMSGAAELQNIVQKLVYKLSSTELTYNQSDTFIADDVTDKYNGLLGQITDRMNTLRDALSQSQDIQDNLDSLLRWLAKVEGEFSQLENTVVVAKREPMEECCNRQKVILKIFFDCH